MGIKRPPQPVKNAATVTQNLVGLAACLIVLLPPFFPDEKLVRLKLRVFETLLLVLAGGVGLQMIFSPHVSQRSSANVKTASQRLSLLTRTLFFGWGLAAVFLWYRSDNVLLATPELRRVLVGISAFFLFYEARLTDEWKRAFFGANALSAGLLALYALLQRNGGFGMIQVPQMERVMGTSGNPIMFGAYLVGSLALTTAGLALEKKGIGLLYLVSLCVQLVALSFTKTRASMLAVGGATVLGTVLLSSLSDARQRKKVFLMLGGLLLVGLFLTHNFWGRDQAHLLIWRDTLKLWRQAPLLGVGLGSFHVNFPDVAGADLIAKWPTGQFIVNYAHNEIIQMLAEGGLFLTGFFLAGVTLFFWLFGRWVQKEKENSTGTLLARSLVPALALGAAALLIQSLFSVDMRFGLSLGAFFLLLGLALRAMDDGTPLTQTKAAPVSTHPVLPGGAKTHTVFKIAAAVLWIGFLVKVVAPQILKPYKAQTEVAGAKDFFDLRLLDPAKTIKDMEALYQKFPEEEPVIERLAFFYAKEMMSGDRKINMAMAEKALRTYHAWMEKFPSNATPANNNANVLYTLGRSDEAIALWEEALRRNPNFTDAHLNLGKVLYTKGRLKEAALHFKAVLNKDPNNPEAIVTMKKMVE